MSSPVVSVSKNAQSLAYQLNEGPTAANRAAVAVADPVALDDALVVGPPGLPRIGCVGRQTVAVSGRFATGAGETVVVRVVRYAADDSLLSWSKGTLTSEVVTDGTLFMAPPLYFDTQGAAYVRLVVELPTAAVDLYAEVS